MRPTDRPDLPLLGLVREDLSTHGRSWTHPGFHALAVYRFGSWAIHRSSPLGALVRLAHRVAYVLVRNLYGVELPVGAVIGRRVRLPHATGVVVGSGVHIGDDCLIRQNVSLGAINSRRPSAPTIGDGVEIGAGAVVFGPVTVGDLGRIGPNAVVMTDVLPGATAVSPRAQVLPRLRQEPERAG